MFSFLEGYFIGRFITFILAAILIVFVLLVLFQILLILLKVAAVVFVGYGIFSVGKAAWIYGQSNG